MAKRIRVFLLSSGLDRDYRGFESHTRDLFTHLLSEGSLHCFILKGGGHSQDHEMRIRTTLPRKSWLATVLGGLVHRSGYYIQNVTFFIGCVPHLLVHKPDILYLGEPSLYAWLARWRRLSGQRYTMIFFTGGGAVPGSFSQNDKLQLVSPVHYAKARQRGVSEAQIHRVPHFLNLHKDSIDDQTKRESKAKLQLNPDVPVILSVGALDASVKRMDYVIEEVSKMDRPFFLVLLGEEETGTPSIVKLAAQKLPPNSFLIKRVDRELLSTYYLAADVFVLASLEEGFGLVMAEAMAFGLPVIANDFATARYVLGDLGCCIDMTKPGNLCREITRALLDPDIKSKTLERRESIYKRFGWNELQKDYLKMFSVSED